MYKLITIILVIVAVVVTFTSPVAGWILYVIPTLFLWLTISVARKTWKWPEITELSARANAMIKKYGHFYNYPYASRSASAAASALTLAAIPMAIINLFQGFWWGALFAIVGYILTSRVAWQFNPTQFINDSAKKGVTDAMVDKEAHEEVIDYIMKKRTGKTMKELDEQFGNKKES